MTLGGIQINDIVLVDIRGQRSFGRVVAKGPDPDHFVERGQLLILPIGLNNGTLRARSRQVIGHYKRMKGGRV